MISFIWYPCLTNCIESEFSTVKDVNVLTETYKTKYWLCMNCSIAIVKMEQTLLMLFNFHFSLWWSICNWFENMVINDAMHGTFVILENQICVNIYMDENQKLSIFQNILTYLTVYPFNFIKKIINLKKSLFLVNLIDLLF